MGGEVEEIVYSTIFKVCIVTNRGQHEATAHNVNELLVILEGFRKKGLLDPAAYRPPFMGRCQEEFSDKYIGQRP